MSGAVVEDAPRAMVHANALLIGSIGVLLRGPSGAGKSTVTLDLLARAAERGDFARLIGDDRVELVNRNGRLVARPHPAIAGLMEIRGLGVVETPHESAGVIRLVVDLLAEGAPLPEHSPAEAALTTKLCGVTLPRLAGSGRDGVVTARILMFIHKLVAK